MSAPGPARPSGVLATVSERLASAPLQGRTRFLHELASDLEALTSNGIAEGLDPCMARARAAEALVPDETSAAWLSGILASRYTRLTRAWDGSRLRRAERVTLAVASLLVLFAQTQAILRTGLARYASPFLWLVVASGTILAAVVLAKAFQLWIRKDHRTPRQGLGAMLFLSMLPTGIALAGVWVDASHVAAALERTPSLASDLLPHALAQNAALLSVAILFGLFGGLSWLVATQWITVLEEAHRRALALEPTPITEIRP